MLYFSEQLPDGRYGIYINGELAAYISCPETYEKLVKSFKERTFEANKAEVAEVAQAIVSCQ